MTEILSSPWTWLIAIVVAVLIIAIVPKWLDGKDDRWMP